MNKLNWSFAEIWNQSLETRKERELRERRNIWASELGKAPIDIYLKCRAVPMTNPPDCRSFRKFEAGNIWEWIVGTVLKRAGILMDQQEWLSYQYPGLLQVTGKLDFLAGGKPDWEKALQEIVLAELPNFIYKAAEGIITQFKKMYPDGLKPIVLEIKSCSSYMYEIYEKSNKASGNHRNQTFHYLKAKAMDEAHIVYVSRDDARLLELGVMNPGPVEDEYKKEIEKLTYFINNNTQPPVEPEVMFNEDTCKFSENWKVKYSSYLTMLYGYKHQSDYEEVWKSRVSSWNRVLARIVEEKKMTEKNAEAITDIKKNFKNFDELVEKAKKQKIL